MLDNEIVEFLINESYNLFCKLRGYYNLSEEMNKKQKEYLKSMYINAHNKNDKIYIAYQSNLIVGCACINEGGYLRDLFVKDEYQNQGIGSLLLERIISDIEENKEIMINTYPQAIDFYKKHNFKVIGKSDNFVKMKRKN